MWGRSCGRGWRSRCATSECCSTFVLPGGGRGHVIASRSGGLPDREASTRSRGAIAEADVGPAAVCSTSERMSRPIPHLASYCHHHQHGSQHSQPQARLHRRRRSSRHVRCVCTQQTSGQVQGHRLRQAARRWRHGHLHRHRPRQVRCLVHQRRRPGLQPCLREHPQNVPHARFRSDRSRDAVRIFLLNGGSHQCVPACRISFGKGENFWTNVFPSELVTQFKGDIAKFGTALSTIKKLEPIFAMIPVHAMLKMFRFSTGFGERMVYPLVALFFGTGNQTPYISSAILVRVNQSVVLYKYLDLTPRVIRNVYSWIPV